MESDYAREGTFAHLIAGWALEDNVPAANYLGRMDESGDFQVDAAMAAAIQVYLDAVAVWRLFEDVHRMDVEVRVTAIPGDVWGTSDLIVWAGGGRHLHVWDYKHGAGLFVDVVNNPQLLTYALGALREHPEYAATVETITMHVVQPRCREPFHRWHTVTPAELWEFGERLTEGVYAAKRDNAPLVAGEHCRFCPVKSSCPMLRDQSLHAARRMFSDVDTMTPKVVAPKLDDMTPAETARALDALPTVELWVKAVKEHAENLARRGVTIPGRKIVQTTGHRTWRDPEQAAAELRRVGVDPFEAPKLVSPAQAEKLAGKDVVAALVSRPKTGVVFASLDDKRPAYNPAAVFAAPTGSDTLDELFR